MSGVGIDCEGRLWGFIDAVDLVIDGIAVIFAHGEDQVAILTEAA